MRRGRGRGTEGEGCSTTTSHPYHPVIAAAADVAVSAAMAEPYPFGGCVNLCGSACVYVCVSPPAYVSFSVGRMTVQQAP